jgi:predicted Zn-dependent protease
MANGIRGLWCVAILAFGAAHGQERQPGQGLNFYSREKEIALGQQLAETFRQETTPLDSAVTSEYVKRVGANLAAHFPGGWTYQIETIREDRGGETHEPAAFPGGFIFVPADLITTARNEAEFAGMLAHAMAHVVARHWTRSATKNELVRPTVWVGSTAPMGMLAFQRANEREADYRAVQAMAAAGYDPAGLASYVGRVQLAPGKRAVSAVFDPLPPRDQRVAAIEAEIRKLPAGVYRTSDEFDRVAPAVAKRRR